MSNITKNDEKTAAAPIRSRHPIEILFKKEIGGAIPRAGDVVEGTILEKSRPRLFIDLGILGTGIIYGREYYAAENLIKGLNPGDKISAKVVELDNDEGYMELSLKDAGAEKNWTELKSAMQEGRILELPVTEANRGGLIVGAFGIKGFLPVSQLSSKNYPRVEGGDKEKIFQELQKFVGKPLKLKILDVNPKEDKLIFTEKGLDFEELKTVLAKYKVGGEVEGEITGVVDFGAFMKFKDAELEGLIHISEIDWTLIEDPRKILKTGDKVKTKIIDIRDGKISLSLKAMKEDPWLAFSQKHRKGEIIKGRVTKFNPFGAFVELDLQIHPVRNESEAQSKTALEDAEKREIDTPDKPDNKQISNGIQGLLHISEFGNETKMKKQIEIGQEYDFKIQLIDSKEHRIALGIPSSETSTTKNEVPLSAESAEVSIPEMIHPVRNESEAQSKTASKDAEKQQEEDVPAEPDNKQISNGIQEQKTEESTESAAKETQETEKAG